MIFLNVPKIQNKMPFSIPLPRRRPWQYAHTLTCIARMQFCTTLYKWPYRPTCAQLNKLAEFCLPWKVTCPSLLRKLKWRYRQLRRVYPTCACFAREYVHCTRASLVLWRFGRCSIDYTLNEIKTLLLQQQHFIMQLFHFFFTMEWVVVYMPIPSSYFYCYLVCNIYFPQTMIIVCKLTLSNNMAIKSIHSIFHSMQNFDTAVLRLVHAHIFWGVLAHW